MRATHNSFYFRQPLVFAHRGANQQAPANTLPAFARALELGADGVELDAHLSADGVPVVIHDFNLETTTDGRGPVSAKRLAELKELDAGRHFGPAFAGERIPTLAEVFEAFGQNLLINVELKAAGLGSRGLEAAVAALVRRHGLEKRVLVSSFNVLTLRRIKRLLPEVPGGLLYAPDMPIYLRRAWLAALCPHEARHPHHSMVTPDFMRQMRARGYRVNVWTVNEAERMRRLAELGVDVIISDRPEVLKQVVDVWSLEGHGKAINRQRR